MNKKYSELAELFSSEKTDEEILNFLLNYHKNDIADMMAGMTEEERKRLYHLLGAQKVAEIFKYIEEPRKYIRELSVESAARVISEMDSDDAVDLLEDLDPEEKEQIVRMLDEDAKKDVKMLLSYDEEEIGEGDVRTVLHFHPAIAPVKVGVLPLSKKLNEGAEKIYAELSKYYNCEFDDRGNIGKRYRRQDEIGTPFCITYDFESETDHAVTVRDRDTMEQVRIPISELKSYLEDKFSF